MCAGISVRNSSEYWVKGKTIVLLVDVTKFLSLGIAPFPHEFMAQCISKC